MFTSSWKIKKKRQTLSSNLSELYSKYMKRFLTAVFAFFLVSGIFAQQQNPVFDSVLAKQYGADAYGMKSYMLVILKTGTLKTDNRAFVDSCFRGHLDNIGRLAKSGDLVVAGPLGKNDLTYRGIFILNAKTAEEAEALLKSDPAVASGLLGYELLTWYGSAALPAYLEVSEKIWKLQP